MAELYLKQGFRDKAVEIYRAFVRERPEQRQAARRLYELENRGGSMSFREHLQAVVDDVPGAMCAMLMGFDGIPIDTYEAEPIEIDANALVTEYSAAVQQLRLASQPAGSLQELTVGAEAVTVLLRPITEEYFMAVLIRPEALLGKIRYKMRVAAPKLAKEIGC